MTNLTETINYDAGIYQLEITDKALGGATGKINAGALNLANRTAYLKAHVDILENAAKRASRVTGVLIPMYIYPGDIFSNANYNNVIDIKKKYHAIPLTVVLNPSNGPGTEVDGNFTYAIKRLHGAGVTVTGYISTEYGNRSAVLVKADVDCWRSFYPEIDGLFFDEMNNMAGGEPYYADLYQTAHNKGFYPVIGNPGSGTLGSYFSTLTADIIIIHENDDYPSEATIKGDYADGYMDYPYTRRAALIYGKNLLDAGQLAILSKYTGHIYISDGVLPNPWGTIPAYLDTLFSMLSLIASGQYAP